MIDRLRFAFVTLAGWPSGYYHGVPRHAPGTNLDLVFTSATTPTGTGSAGRPRRAACHPVRGRDRGDLRTVPAPPHPLSSSDLRPCTPASPFLAVWDDHEVANDYSGIWPEFGPTSPEFIARRAAAYQAYYEHMPIRAVAPISTRASSGSTGGSSWGGLAEFTMLDDRQYRWDDPSPGAGEALRCPRQHSTGNYTMLATSRSAGWRRAFAHAGRVEHRGATS